MRITCEGFVGDSTLSQQFKRKEDFDKQMEVFCCGTYRYCEVYRMLAAEKYGE